MHFHTFIFICYYLHERLAVEISDAQLVDEELSFGSVLSRGLHISAMDLTPLALAPIKCYLLNWIQPSHTKNRKSIG